MTTPIRCLVADDHPMFREGLRFVLEQADDVMVVAEAADGRAAVEAVAEHAPDVVLMDLNMPGVDGLAATREVAASARVLVLTMHDDDANVVAALRAGASGYLLKGAGPEEVISAVRAVAGGQAVFGAALAGRVLRTFTEGRPPEPVDLSARFPQLSTREHEVLSHLAEGLSNQQIADLLVISPITVRNHVTSILTKLQLRDRRQAMLRAREGGA